MPVIKPKNSDNISQTIRVSIKRNVFKEMESYCEWAKIKNRNYFIEQACRFVFDKDKDWQACKNTDESKK